jgi:hypothetical protein
MRLLDQPLIHKTAEITVPTPFIPPSNLTPGEKKELVYKSLAGAGVGALAGGIGQYLLTGRLGLTGAGLGAIAGGGATALSDDKFRDYMKSWFDPGKPKPAPEQDKKDTKPPVTAPPPPDPDPTMTTIKNVTTEQTPDHPSILQERSKGNVDPTEHLQETYGTYFDNRNQLAADPAKEQQLEADAAEHVRNTAPYMVRSTPLPLSPRNLPAMGDTNRQNVMTEYVKAYMLTYGGMPDEQTMQNAEKAILEKTNGQAIQGSKEAILREIMPFVVNPPEAGFKDYALYERNRGGQGILPWGHGPDSGQWGRGASNLLQLGDRMVSDPEMAVSVSGNIAGRIVPEVLKQRGGLIKHIDKLAKTEQFNRYYNRAALASGKKMPKMGNGFIVADAIIDGIAMASIDPATGKPTVGLDKWASNLGEKSEQELAMLAGIAVNGKEAVRDSLLAMQSIANGDYKTGWNAAKTAAVKNLSGVLLPAAGNVLNPTRAGMAYGYKLVDKGVTAKQKQEAYDYYDAVRRLQKSVKKPAYGERFAANRDMTADQLFQPTEDLASAKQILMAVAKSKAGMMGDTEGPGYSLIQGEYQNLLKNAVNDAAQITPLNLGRILSVTSKGIATPLESLPVAEGIPGLYNIISGQGGYSQRIEGILNENYKDMSNVMNLAVNEYQAELREKLDDPSFEATFNSNTPEGVALRERWLEPLRIQDPNFWAIRAQRIIRRNAAMKAIAVRKEQERIRKVEAQEREQSKMLNNYSFPGDPYEHRPGQGYMDSPAY